VPLSDSQSMRLTLFTLCQETRKCKPPIFIFLRTLLPHPKCQTLCFQAIPHSLAKTPGGGVPGRTPSGTANLSCLSRLGSRSTGHGPLVQWCRCAAPRKVPESPLLLGWRVGVTPGNISASSVSNIPRADIGFGIRRLPNPVASRSQKVRPGSYEQEGLGPPFQGVDLLAGWSG
jgi:hypothetical protein